MTGTAPDGTALEPVRAEILRQARAEAAAAVARAEAEAGAMVARARAEADAVLDAARTRGLADADQALRADAARAGREARAIGLRARREVYESWRSAVIEGVRGLKEGPDYPAILAGLTARARDLLGPGAEITDDPAGGLVATAAGRSADLTLEAIAARAVADAAMEAGVLWTG